MKQLNRAALQLVDLSNEGAHMKYQIEIEKGSWITLDIEAGDEDKAKEIARNWANDHISTAQEARAIKQYGNETEFVHVRTLPDGQFDD